MNLMSEVMTAVVVILGALLGAAIAMTSILGFLAWCAGRYGADPIMLWLDYWEARGHERKKASRR